MNITEVRIKLMDEPGDRLKAFCSITFDDSFVIRDLKIIEGASGLFVAMPSRKLTAHCSKCGMKNHLRANFCNQCGVKLDESRIIKDSDGRTKLYADIAHPINSRCRESIQNRVVDEYYEEIERAKSPDYVSRYDDYDGGDYDDTVVSRRFDEPHRSQAESRPHHPPQGDPLHKHPSAQPSGPQGSHHHGDPGGRELSARDRSDESDRRDGTTGFGAGIF